MTVFECFSGIGAQHKALTNLYNKNEIDNFKILGISEWYIPAIIAYAKIHYNKEFYFLLKDLKLSKEDILDKYKNKIFSNDSKNPCNLSKLKEQTLKELYIANLITNNYGSIIDIKGKEMPCNIDVLTYSFPCQDLSQIGKGAGMKKGSNTRSGLLWEVLRILQEMKNNNKLPKSLLMENVTAIYNKNNKEDLILFLEELKLLGYSSKCYELNVKNYGVPQNRNRAFVISYLSNKPEIYFLLKEKSKEKFPYIYTPLLKNYLNWNNEFFNSNYIEEENKCIPNKTPTRYNILKGSKFRKASIYLNNSKYCNTITTKQDRNPNAGIIINNDWFRFLTPRECFLLMGFTNNDYDYINNFSYNKLYKLAGNSIGVNVLEILFKDMENEIKKI